MTRLLVLSDFHLEHRPMWSLPDAFPPFDVAVFAGDVDGSPERAVHRLAQAPGLSGRPIVYVPGNHEFYEGCIEQRLAAGKAACAGTRIHMLDRDVVVLAGVRFVGAILWTDYHLFGDPNLAMDACRRGLNDHRLVEIGPPGRRQRFQLEHAAALHARDRAFIEAAMTIPFAGPTVVVTHHAPHRGSVATRFAQDPVTAGFVSDLGDVIRHGRAALWIHGHVHDAFDYSVDVTRVLANPKGYGPKRRGGSPENKAFDPGLVVEVQHEDARDDTTVANPEAGRSPQTIAVARWTILRVGADGDRHVFGYRTENGRGRTSSPIRSFDRETMTATTASGNRYVLVGEPSDDGLYDPAILAWLVLHGLSCDNVEAADIDDL